MILNVFDSCWLMLTHIDSCWLMLLRLMHIRGSCVTFRWPADGWWFQPGNHSQVLARQWLRQWWYQHRLQASHWTVNAGEPRRADPRVQLGSNRPGATADGTFAESRGWTLEGVNCQAFQWPFQGRIQLLWMGDLQGCWVCRGVFANAHSTFGRQRAETTVGQCLSHQAVEPRPRGTRIRMGTLPGLLPGMWAIVGCAAGGRCALAAGQCSTRNVWSIANFFLRGARKITPQCSGHFSTSWCPWHIFQTCTGALQDMRRWPWQCSERFRDARWCSRPAGGTSSTFEVCLCPLGVVWSPRLAAGSAKVAVLGPSNRKRVDLQTQPPDHAGGHGKTGLEPQLQGVWQEHQSPCPCHSQPALGGWKPGGQGHRRDLGRIPSSKWVKKCRMLLRVLRLEAFRGKGSGVPRPLFQEFGCLHFPPKANNIW